MIRLSSSGDFKKISRWLTDIPDRITQNLEAYGQMGVDALRSSTPVDTGLTADSWRFRVIRNRKRPGIEWYNTNVVNGVPVAVLIQYGHGTGTGGYVQGRDYINPAMRAVFDEIADKVWKEVTG